jgi:hypothetical protein
VLDLSALDFAGPHLVTRVAAWLDLQARFDRAVTVVPPRDQRVANYLSRVGLADNLPDACDFPLCSVRARDRRDALLELTRVRSPDEIDDMALRLGRLLGAHFAGPFASIVRAMVLSLQELCDNATTHGESDLGAYVAAQRYQSSRCILAIGDLGVGIPEHIRRTHRGLDRDGAAIAHATRPGATGTHDDDRGDGYRAMLATVRRGRVPATDLAIWSGTGRHRVQLRGAGTGETRTLDDAPVTAGTWIALEMRTA